MCEGGLWGPTQLGCPELQVSGAVGVSRGVPGPVGACRGLFGLGMGVSGNAPKFWMSRTSYVVSSPRVRRGFRADLDGMRTDPGGCLGLCPGIGWVLRSGLGRSYLILHSEPPRANPKPHHKRN